MHRYLETIVNHRTARVAADGPAQSLTLPSAPPHAPHPFLQRGTVICEFKRQSPSRGVINAKVTPVEQAGIYANHGATTLSVLTEERYFGGSLADLIAIKSRYPHLCLLRKDFLLTADDIEISYRAGADAILLIAAMHSRQQLGDLIACAHRYQLAALVEVHTLHELHHIAPLRPQYIGINSRDLRTFHVDRLIPLQLIAEITWKCHVVFESGIYTAQDARLACRAGFHSVLVGEALMREPHRIPSLLAAIDAHVPHAALNTPDTAHTTRAYRLWPIIARTIGRQSKYRPMVKICGITNRNDADNAQRAGADILGFVLAQSPRHITPDDIMQFADYSILKVAVVTDLSLWTEIEKLWTSGVIDGIQFHDPPSPHELADLDIPYIVARTIHDQRDIDDMRRWHSPRILTDSHHAASRDKASSPIDNHLLHTIKMRIPLWVAGGITPQNVRDLVCIHQPELIDISSGIEQRPGIKSSHKMNALFAHIQEAL